MVEMKHSVFGAVGTPPAQEEHISEKQISVDDLQSLIELGCIRDSIQIGNKTFNMRSLNASERRDLGKFLASKETSDEHSFNFNIKLLAMSIESVDGKPFESLHGNQKLDPYVRKQELLSVMQTPVLSKLLSFYNVISEKCDGQFGVEEVKN